MWYWLCLWLTLLEEDMNLSPMARSNKKGYTHMFVRIDCGAIREDINCGAIREDAAGVRATDTVTWTVPKNCQGTIVNPAIRLDCMIYFLVGKILIRGLTSKLWITYMRNLTHIACDCNSLLLSLLISIRIEDLFLVEFYAHTLFLLQTSQIYQWMRSLMYEVEKSVESNGPLYPGYSFYVIASVLEILIVYAM